MEMGKINAEENVHLIAKVLDDKRNADDRVVVSLYDKAYSLLEREMRTALSEATGCPQRGKIFDRMQTVLDERQIYLSYPNLLGKTLVGILAFDKKLFSTSMDLLIGNQASHVLNIQQNIPCLIMSQTTHEIAADNGEHIIEMKWSEYANASTGFGHQIDTSAILHTYIVHSTFNYSDIILCYFPSYASKRTEVNRNLLSNLDAMVIYGWPQGEKEVRGLAYYTKQCIIQGIPIYTITSNDKIFIADGLKRWNELSINPQRLYSILNTNRQNHLFTDKLSAIYGEVEVIYQETLNRIIEDSKQIQADIVSMSDNKTKEISRNLSQSLNTRKKQLEKEYQNLKHAWLSLRKSCEKIEEELAKTKDLDGKCQPLMLVVWKKLFLQSINLAHYDNAGHYLRKLSHFQADDTYVCDLILRNALGQDLPSHLLQKLRNAIDTEFIRHAKLRLSCYMGFSDSDYMQIARDLRRLDLPVDFYYRGRWEEANQNLGKAFSLYRKALTEGVKDAAPHLWHVSQQLQKSMDIVDQMSVPEWAYQAGLESINHGKYARGQVLLKVAASCEYLPAILKLADDFYNKIHRNYYKNISEQERTSKLENCLQMYTYIYKHNPQDKNSQERLGYLYKDIGDERRAVELWQRAATANGYYECGRLYQYHQGSLPQDLKKAEYFFSKATQKGHQKAAQELRKVKSWQQKNQQDKSGENVYSSQKDYSSHVTSNRTHDDDGGCFITTATCLALGKGVECDELIIMRQFRDYIRGENSYMSDLIDEYYRIAPILISKIREEPREQSTHVYKILWQKYIKPCYDDIMQGNGSAATVRYINMAEMLAKRYAVPFSNGINYKINLLRKELEAFITK